MQLKYKMELPFLMLESTLKKMRTLSCESTVIVFFDVILIFKAVVDEDRCRETSMTDSTTLISACR